jgi:hypothetical protein
MGYSKQELKEELLRCYGEQGETSSKTLNDPATDYPTQMTYSNHFGSLTAAKESVGILGGHTRERVLSDIEKCFDKNDNVSVNLLNDSDDFINSSTLYEHFDSLWTAIELADIDVESIKDKKNTQPNVYDREELLSKLQDCYDENGNTKTETVNNFDGCPSSQAYKSRFGSIKSARKEIGISTEFQKHKVREKIKNIDGFKKSASAHIYVLELTVNGETAYYVGESTNLEKRLQSHFYNTKIQTWSHGKHGKILSPRTETNKVNDVSVDRVKYVIPMRRKENETANEFRKRRKLKEHHTHLSVAIENKTVEVYGGR